jgi:hypothetical protein
MKLSKVLGYTALATAATQVSAAPAEKRAVIISDGDPSNDGRNVGIAFGIVGGIALAAIAIGCACGSCSKCSKSRAKKKREANETTGFDQTRLQNGTANVTFPHLERPQQVYAPYANPYRNLYEMS